MNKKILTSFIALSILAQNISFAEVINSNGSTSFNSKDVALSEQFKVIESLKGQKDGLGDVGAVLEQGNPLTGGVQSRVQAYYIQTPELNKWEYSSISQHDTSAPPTVHVNCYNHSSSGWLTEKGSNITSFGGAGAYRTNARGHFKTYHGNGAYSNLSKYTETDLPNLKIYTNDAGEKYISDVLYVRYLFDIENPLLLQTHLAGTGPYRIGGDYSPADQNLTGHYATQVITKDKVIADPEKFLEKIESSSPYLHLDQNAIFQKDKEYRRTVTSIGNPDEEDSFEVIYPSSKTETVSKTPGTGKTMPGNVSTTSVGDTYKISVNLKPMSSSYQPKSPNTYKLNEYGEGGGSNYQKEPNYQQMLLWHDNVKATLSFVHPNGTKALIKNSNGQWVDKITIPQNNSTITLNKADVNHGVSIHGFKAMVNVEYLENVRYLETRVRVGPRYTIVNNKGNVAMKDETYTTTMNYIGDKANQGASIFTTQLNTIHNSAQKYQEDTYKTQVSNRTSALNSYIVVPGESSNFAPDVKVKTDPPNSLTKAEGGKFRVIVTGLMPENEKGRIATVTYHSTYGSSGEKYDFMEWHDDLEIERIRVIAQNKSTIYDISKGNPKMPTFSGNQLITDYITANPDQIGKAEVIVDYSYNTYVRSVTSTGQDSHPSSDPDDATPEVVCYTKTYSTSVDSKKDVETGSINIYTLSGNTKN